MKTINLAQSKKSQNSAKQKDSSNSNYELIERTDVPETPFVLIQTEGKYFGVMGAYRITEPHDTKEEAMKDLTKMSWNRLIQVMIILIESKAIEKLRTNNTDKQ